MVYSHTSLTGTQVLKLLLGTPGDQVIYRGPDVDYDSNVVAEATRLQSAEYSWQ